MDIKNVNVDAVDIMNNVNLTVTFKLKRAKELHIRLFVARMLIKLASLIANCNIEIV